MKLCFWPWDHDWEKWNVFKQFWREPYKGQLVTCDEDWQKRKCKKCGKEQREKV